MNVVQLQGRAGVAAIQILFYAGMAELADALDLGSSVHDVQVQVLLPAFF